MVHKLKASLLSSLNVKEKSGADWVQMLHQNFRYYRQNKLLEPYFDDKIALKHLFRICRRQNYRLRFNSLRALQGGGIRISLGRTQLPFYNSHFQVDFPQRYQSDPQVTELIQ
jgi:hypothetical protein